MEIQFNPGQNSVAATNKPIDTRGSSSTVENTMSFDFNRTGALEQTLKDTSQVRPEKVAQAGALAADPDYPSDDVLDSMAGLLADHIGS